MIAIKYKIIIILIMINKDKYMEKMTAPEFLDGFTVQQISIPKVQLSNKKAINSVSKKSLSPKKDSVAPQALIVYSPKYDTNKNVTRALSSSNPPSPGKTQDKRALKQAKSRQQSVIPTLPNATKESHFNIQEQSFYQNQPSDTYTTVVKVQLHQRNNSKLKSPPKKLETEGSSQEFSPDKSNHVMMPKALEVNPLSAEDSNDFSQPHRMSSMEKRGSVNPTSLVSIQDMSALPNNGNARGPQQFQILSANSMHNTQKTQQIINNSRERTQSPKTKSYVPSRGQSRLSAVKEQEQFQTMDQGKTPTSLRKLETVKIEDNSSKGRHPDANSDQNKVKPPQSTKVARQHPSGKNLTFNKSFGNVFDAAEKQKKRTNISSRRDQNEEKDDAEEFKSQGQITIVSSYLEGGPTGPSGDKSPKQQNDIGLEPVIEMQNSAPESPDIKRENVASVQPSFMISPGVKKRKAKDKEGVVSADPNMRSLGKKKPAPFSNQVSVRREVTPPSQSAEVHDFDNVSTHERQSQNIIQKSQETSPSNKSFKVPDTQPTQQTPLRKGSKSPDDDEYHQETYESGTGKKTSGKKAQGAEFYQVKYSRQNMTRTPSKKTIPNNQDLGIKNQSKKKVIGTQQSDERNREKISKSPERQNSTISKTHEKREKPTTRNLKKEVSVVHSPSPEIQNSQKVKVASQALSPTSQTDYQQLETIAPSQYGWAGNSGSQFSVMKSSFGNYNKDKQSIGSSQRESNLMRGDGAQKEIEEIHYQLQLLRQRNQGNASSNPHGRKVKTLQQVALEIAHNEDREVQRINQRHYENQRGSQSQLKINIQNVDALDGVIVNERGGRSGFALSGAGSGQQSQERLATYANMTLEQLEKEYETQEKKREQSLKELNKMEEQDKPEESEKAPSPQIDKSLSPSKITYVALPLTQPNIIPNQHRSKSTLHTDYSRLGIQIGISRNLSKVQIGSGELNSRFKSSQPSDVSLRKEGSHSVLPHQISNYLADRDLMIQGTLDRNNPNMYKIQLDEDRELVNGVLQRKFDKQKVQMFNTKATINKIMKKKFSIQMDVENYNQMASRSSLHERSQLIHSKRVSINDKILAGQKSQLAQQRGSLQNQGRRAVPTHNASVLSNESFKLDDKQSQLAPFPDKLSNFDSTLKAGFAASPRYLGTEDAMSIKVKDEAEIQNQIADMSMQELTLKLTREMKQNSEIRQRKILRRLESIPIYGERSPDGQIIDEHSSHYQGIGNQYFMPPAFGNKSPRFTSQNQTIRGDKNVKIILPAITSNQSMQGTQNSRRFSSVQVGYEAVGVDARTISQSPEGMTQTTISPEKPTKPNQESQQNKFFGQQPKEGIYQIHEIMNGNLKNEARDRLNEKKKKMQAVMQFRVEMQEQVKRERQQRNQRLRARREQSKTQMDRPPEMTVNQAISEHFGQMSAKMPVVFENKSLSQNTDELSPKAKAMKIKRIQQLKYHNLNLHRLLTRLESELGNQQTTGGLKVLEHSSKLRKSQEALLEAQRLKQYKREEAERIQLEQEIQLAQQQQAQQAIQPFDIQKLSSKKVNFQSISNEEMEQYIEQLEMGGQQLSNSIQKLTGSKPSLQNSRGDVREIKGQSPFIRNNNKRPQPLQVSQEPYGAADSDNNSSIKNQFTSFEINELGLVSPQGMSYIDPGTAIRDDRKQMFSPNGTNYQQNIQFPKQEEIPTWRMNFDQVENQASETVLPQQIQTQDGGFNPGNSDGNYQQSSEKWSSRPKQQSEKSIINKLSQGRNTVNQGTKNAHNTLRDENMIKLTSIDAATNEQSVQESVDKNGIIGGDQIVNATLDQMQFLPSNAQSPTLPPLKKVNFQNEDTSQVPGAQSVENPIYQIKETAGKQASFNRSYMKNSDLDLPEESGGQTQSKFRSSSYKEQQMQSQKLSQPPVIKIEVPKRNIVQKVGPNAGLPGSFSPIKAIEPNSGKNINENSHFILDDSEQRGQELQQVIQTIQIDRINKKRASMPQVVTNQSSGARQQQISEDEEESAYIDEMSSTKRQFESIEQQQMLHLRNKQRVLQTISAALAKSPTAMRVAVNLKTPKPQMVQIQHKQVQEKAKQQINHQEELQKIFESQVSARSLRSNISVSKLKDPRPQQQVHMLQILKKQHKENKKSRLRAKSVLATHGNVPILSRPSLGLNEYYLMQQQQADPTASSRTLMSTQNNNNYASNGSLITPLQRQFLLKQMPEKAKLIEEHNVDHQTSREYISNMTMNTNHRRGASNVSVQQRIPTKVELPRINTHVRHKSQLQSYQHYTIDERVAQLTINDRISHLKQEYESPVKQVAYNQVSQIEGY